MTDDLQRWLNDVTTPFSYATAQRLRRELETHAEDTARNLRAGGHPDPEAAALQALGPAREVRRRLEETHFTLAELMWLREDRATRRALEEGFYPRGWIRIFAVLAYAFIVLLPLIDWRVNGVFSWPPAVLWWGFNVATACAERFVFRKYFRVAAVILWRLLGMLSVPFSLTLVQLFMRNVGRDWTAMLFGALVSCCILWFMRPRAALALLPKALRNAVSAAPRPTDSF